MVFVSGAVRPGEQEPTMTNTNLRTLAIEAGGAGDYATVALCLLAIGRRRADMPAHIRAACPPRIRAAGARRLLEAAAAARA
jgi:hypothetical protein